MVHTLDKSKERGKYRAVEEVVGRGVLRLQEWGEEEEHCRCRRMLRGMEGMGRKRRVRR